MRLFSRWAETIVLVAPLLGFLGVIVQIRLVPSPSLWTRHIFAIFSQIIFLNTIHIIFTYDLVVVIPEYRAILKNRKWQIGSLILASVFAIALAAKFLETRLEGNLGIALIGAIVGYDIYHFVKQTLGLSLLYNFRSLKLLDGLGDRQRLRQIDFQERVTCLSMVFLGVAQLVLGPWIQNRYPDWAKFEKFAMAGVGSVAVLFLMLQYYRLNGRLFRNKIIFIARYALVMSTIISFFGLVALRSVHGIEYFFVYKRIKGQAITEGEKVIFWHRAIVLFIAAIVIVGIFFDPNHGVVDLFHLEKIADNYWFRTLSLIVGALSLLHYFLDGRIFAMRNEAVRNSTGRWLLEETSRQDTV